MTKLIVALDGSNPLNMLYNLYDETGCSWFKIGPQTIVHQDWPTLLGIGVSMDVNIFLDLKLADTRETCREAVRRFAEAEIAAVSTFTDAATEAAIEGATGSALKVWRVVRLTDEKANIEEATRNALHAAKSGAHGMITYGSYGRQMLAIGIFKGDFVVPGVRLGLSDANHGHSFVTYADRCVELGVTYAVVGRPIWAAADPVAAARAYIEALDDH